MSTTTLGADNVIKKVYDPGTETLKVNAIATIPPGIMEITISDTDDSIKIGDGHGDYLAINPDGSINANVTIVVPPSTTVVKNIYNEVTSVAQNTLTTINTYTVPVGKIAIVKNVSAAGSNIATFDIIINGVVQAKKYTNFGSNPNVDFIFDSLKMNAGDIINIRVTHPRPYVGDFNSNLQVEET